MCLIILRSPRQGINEEDFKSLSNRRRRFARQVVTIDIVKARFQTIGIVQRLDEAITEINDSQDLVMP